MRDHAGVAGGNGNTPAIARCRTKTRGLDSSAGRRACWFVQYGLDLGHNRPEDVATGMP